MTHVLLLVQLWFVVDNDFVVVEMFFAVTSVLQLRVEMLMNKAALIALSRFVQ